MRPLTTHTSSTVLCWGETSAPESRLWPTTYSSGGLQVGYYPVKPALVFPMRDLFDLGNHPAMIIMDLPERGTALPPGPLVDSLGRHSSSLWVATHRQQTISGWLDKTRDCYGKKSSEASRKMLQLSPAARSSAATGAIAASARHAINAIEALRDRDDASEQALGDMSIAPQYKNHCNFSAVVNLLATLLLSGNAELVAVLCEVAANPQEQFPWIASLFTAGLIIASQLEVDGMTPGELALGYMLRAVQELKAAVLAVTDATEETLRTWRSHAEGLSPASPVPGVKQGADQITVAALGNLKSTIDLIVSSSKGYAQHNDDALSLVFAGGLVGSIIVEGSGPLGNFATVEEVEPPSGDATRIDSPPLRILRLLTDTFCVRERISDKCAAGCESNAKLHHKLIVHPECPNPLTPAALQGILRAKSDVYPSEGEPGVQRRCASQADACAEFIVTVNTTLLNSPKVFLLSLSEVTEGAAALEYGNGTLINAWVGGLKKVPAQFPSPYDGDDGVYGLCGTIIHDATRSHYINGGVFVDNEGVSVAFMDDTSVVAGGKSAFATLAVVPDRRALDGDLALPPTSTMKIVTAAYIRGRDYDTLLPEEGAGEAAAGAAGVIVSNSAAAARRAPEVGVKRGRARITADIGARDTSTESGSIDREAEDDDFRKKRKRTWAQYKDDLATAKRAKEAAKAEEKAAKAAAKGRDKAATATAASSGGRGGGRGRGASATSTVSAASMGAGTGGLQGQMPVAGTFTGPMGAEYDKQLQRLRDAQAEWAAVAPAVQAAVERAVSLGGMDASDPKEHLPENSMVHVAALRLHTTLAIIKDTAVAARQKAEADAARRLASAMQAPSSSGRRGSTRK